ncbi:hypothetical protein OM076_30825, partial [Solirubrobacter ginsenosidimutans]|nr:hypothetical protein [Solirubrobacter ginsenosidimutans]
DGRVAAPSRRRRGRLLAASGVLVVSAGAGIALATRGEDPPPPAPVSHAVVARSTPLVAGKVGVTLPPGWSVLSLPVDVPGLPHERAAAPAGKESAGVVLAGMAPRDTHNPKLVSPRLHAGKPSEARLGAFPAYRYEGLRWNGRKLTVYAAPTSAGVATVACLSPAPGCERIAQSLTVPGATAFPLGANPAFAAAANRALKLPSRSLATGTPKAFRLVGGDYRSARSKLARISTGPADEPLRAGLADQLERIAAAYRGLAAARTPGPYANATRRARGAEDALRRTVRGSVYRDAIRVPGPRPIPTLRHAPVVPPPTPTPVPHSDPTPVPTAVATATAVPTAAHPRKPPKMGCDPGPCTGGDG